MGKATRNIFKMHGWRVDRAIHNYIYFRFYRLYVAIILKSGRFLRDKLGRVKVFGYVFKMAMHRYHAKILTAGDAKKMVTLKHDLIVSPDKSSKIIPFKYANKIILKEPEFIAVMDCPCRSHRKNGCRPYDVCIAVGRTTAEFWLEVGQQYHARKISQTEALKIITDARARGCITTAWLKVATGGRTGVICSCCNCCCGGLEGMRIAQSFDKKFANLAPSGYSVTHAPDRCKSCGQCVKSCVFNAVSLDDKGQRIYNRKLCMGCGLCSEKCEQQALSLVRDPAKGEPLDLDMIQATMGGRG